MQQFTHKLIVSEGRSTVLKSNETLTAMLFCAPVDIHAAHTDPFRPGSVHGHLWRVSLGTRQDLARRLDVRVLIAESRAFAAKLDHTHIGEVSSEDIALLALEYCPSATIADVEEVGICRVTVTRT